jgi:hypothetical protein
MVTNDRWVVLPLEIAKQHQLYGVGGRLILVAIRHRRDANSHHSKSLLSNRR